VVLAGTTLARLLGYDAFADRLVAQEAQMAAGLAALLVLYGSTRKVQSQRRKRKAADLYVRPR
jgi:hypothetical protein